MTREGWALIPIFLRMRMTATRNSVSALTAPQSGPRSGTGRKTAFDPSRLVILFGIFSTAMSFGLLSIMAGKFGERMLGSQASDRVLIAAGARSEEFVVATSFMAFAWCVTIVVFALGHQNRDLARLGDDVELLMSLPLSLTSIYFTKVVERSIISLGWIVFAPFYAAVLWISGHRLMAIPVALLITFAMNVLLALLQFVLELSLRRTLETFTLTRIQAVATACASLVLTLATLAPMLFDVSPRAGVVFAHIGRMALVLPGSVLLPLLIRGQEWWRLGAFLVQMAAGLTLGWWIIDRLTRRGLESIQGASRSTRKARPLAGGLTHGVLAKDLMMLRRDARLFATAVAPMIGLIPMLLMPGVFTIIAADPRTWSSVSFGVGMMLVMSTATSAVLHEHDALWLIFSLPASLERVLLQKAILWGALGTITSLTILIAGIGIRGTVVIEDLIGAVWIMAGLSLFAILCVAFAILGTDALAAEKRTRIREDLVIGALILGIVLVGGAIVPRLDMKALLLLFFAVLTWAWWRKAIYRAPALLDPTSWPAPRLELADGMTGVVLLFAAPAALTLAFMKSGLSVGVGGPIGYILSAAGALAVVAGMMREEGLRLREAFPFFTAGLRELREAVAWVSIGAVVSAAALFANVWLVRYRGGVPKAPDGWQLYAAMILGPLVTAVVKPVVEEILFRGIIFRALRAEMPFWIAASISAALSAFMSGPVLAPAFFVAGLASSLALEKSKALLPSIILQVLLMAAMMVVR